MLTYDFSAIDSRSLLFVGLDASAAEPSNLALKFEQFTALCVEQQRIIAALLITGAQHSPELAQVIAQAQAQDVACLIEDDANLAHALQADGVLYHSAQDFTAQAELRTQHQLTAGICVGSSRHQAMEAGESEPDFLFFGTVDQAVAAQEAFELAQWWAQLFEIPCVCANPASVQAPQAKQLENPIEFSYALLD